MKITRLVCKNCGAALSGLGSDILFLCNNCGAGWSTTGSGLEQIAVQYRAGRDSKLPLPFWMIKASVHVLKRTVRNEFTSTMLKLGSRYDEKTLTGKTRESGSSSDRRTFLFPAFPIKGLPGIGVDLSKQIGNLTKESGKTGDFPDVCGGSISSLDAAVLAKCVAVGQETEKADWLAEIEIVVSSVKSKLVILPSVQEVEKVLITGTGLAFFRRSVPSWDEILNYHSRRG